jgi:hypothetical protein
MSEFEPTRWWRVLDFSGRLYAEMSDREEAAEIAERTGYKLQQLWSRTEKEWRDHDAKEPADD